MIAQEKAELMDASDILSNRIEKEEKELEGLEQAMAMLKSSNDQVYTHKLVRFILFLMWTQY